MAYGFFSHQRSFPVSIIKCREAWTTIAFLFVAGCEPSKAELTARYQAEVTTLAQMEKDWAVERAAIKSKAEATTQKWSEVTDSSDDGERKVLHEKETAAWKALDDADKRAEERFKAQREKILAARKAAEIGE
jgi:hypothetical protein